jgi:hypothetical protein
VELEDHGIRKGPEGMRTWHFEEERLRIEAEKLAKLKAEEEEAEEGEGGDEAEEAAADDENAA